jgi:hypothetical protein
MSSVHQNDHMTAVRRPYIIPRTGAWAVMLLARSFKQYLTSVQTQLQLIPIDNASHHIVLCPAKRRSSIPSESTFLSSHGVSPPSPIPDYVFRRPRWSGNCTSLLKKADLGSLYFLHHASSTADCNKRQSIASRCQVIWSLPAKRLPSTRVNFPGLRCLLPQGVVYG